MKLLSNKVAKDADGKILFQCPGCGCLHGVVVDGPASWSWNGDTEKPTISPSILARGKYRCHSFLKDGVWEFLSDSEHRLAGQRVPMVDLPEWLRKEQSHADEA